MNCTGSLVSVTMVTMYVEGGLSVCVCSQQL